MNPIRYPSAGGCYVRRSDGELQRTDVDLSLPASQPPPEPALDQADASPADATPPAVSQE